MRTTRRLAIAATVVALTTGGGLSVASQVSGDSPRHATPSVSHSAVGYRILYRNFCPLTAEDVKAAGPFRAWTGANALEEVMGPVVLAGGA